MKKINGNGYLSLVLRTVKLYEQPQHTQAGELMSVLAISSEASLVRIAKKIAWEMSHAVFRNEIAVELTELESMELLIYLTKFSPRLFGWTVMKPADQFERVLEQLFFIMSKGFSESDAILFKSFYLAQNDVKLLKEKLSSRMARVFSTEELTAELARRESAKLENDPMIVKASIRLRSR